MRHGANQLEDVQSVSKMGLDDFVAIVEAAVGRKALRRDT